MISMLRCKIGSQIIIDIIAESKRFTGKLARCERGKKTLSMHVEKYPVLAGMPFPTHASDDRMCGKAVHNARDKLSVLSYSSSSAE